MRAAEARFPLSLTVPIRGPDHAILPASRCGRVKVKPTSVLQCRIRPPEPESGRRQARLMPLPDRSPGAEAGTIDSKHGFLNEDAA